MHISKIEKMRRSTRSKIPKNDFLGLGDPDRYPKYVKCWNYKIKKYVFLDPTVTLQEIDLYDYHRCNYELKDILADM